MPGKVWDEMTYPFPNFNGCTVEVWEWISDFTQHFVKDVITYPYRDYSYIMLVKGTPGADYAIYREDQTNTLIVRSMSFPSPVHQLLLH